jgi:hypothetical protein
MEKLSPLYPDKIIVPGKNPDDRTRRKYQSKKKACSQVSVFHPDLHRSEERAMRDCAKSTAVRRPRTFDSA